MFRHRSFKFLFLVILVTLTVVAAAGAAGSGPAAAPVTKPALSSDTTLVVAMAQEPESLYLYGPSQLAALHVMQAFMDGPVDSLSYTLEPVILTKIPRISDGDALLNEVTVGDGDTVVDINGDVVTLVPGVAIIDVDGNTVVFDGTPVLVHQMEVTFSWRADVLWSDGAPLTADDSAFSFFVGCHPDTDVSKFLCDRTESYAATNATTTVWTGLPAWLDTRYQTNFWTPLPEHVLGGTPPGAIPGSGYAQHPLGWGPYQVDAWLPGESIQLSRNPYYWRPGLPEVQNLVFVFYPDFSELHEALLTGEVHVATQDAVPGLYESFLDWEADGWLKVHTSTGTVWEHLDFGILPADDRYVFFDDMEVRRALTLCTDRQRMVDEIYFGRSEILHAYVPPEHPLYQASSATEWPFDPAQGRAKLDAAGWTVAGDGWRYKGGQRFAITMITTEGNEPRQQIAAIFKEDMAACGIDVTPEFLPASELFADGPDGPVFGRKFDVAGFAWLAGNPPNCDLYITSQIPQPGNWGAANDTGYSNPAFDAACEAALASLPSTAAYATHHIAALEIFTEETPVIPLFLRVKTTLGNPNVLGIQPDPTMVSEMWNVEEWSLSAMTTVTVGGGGTLVSNDERVTIQAPAGAFSETVTLVQTPRLPEPIGDLYRGGQFFELTATYFDDGEPASLLAGETYSLVVEYSPLQLLSLGSGAGGLGLYYWDGGAWMLDPSSTLDLAGGTVSATPDTFGLWALLSTEESERQFLPVLVR